MSVSDEYRERRRLQGIHRFHRFPSVNSPSTSPGVKRHGPFTVVTIVSCCEHFWIKLYLVKTPSIRTQEEKFVMGLSCSSKSWKAKVWFLPLQPASGFHLQLLIFLRKDKTPPMAFPVNFLPGKPEAVTSFRARRGQLGLCQAGCPGTSGLEEKWWTEKKKKPFLFHFPKASLTPFCFDTKMCKSRVLEWEDGLNSHVWGWFLGSCILLQGTGWGGNIFGQCRIERTFKCLLPSPHSWSLQTKCIWGECVFGINIKLAIHGLLHRWSLHSCKSVFLSVVKVK